MAASRPFRWLRRLLAILIGFLLLYAIVGFLVIPLIVRWQAPRIVEQQLGAQLHIEDVDVNPFSLRAGLYGLQLDDNGETLFTLGGGVADITVLQLFTGNIVITEVLVDEPVAYVTRAEDGTINWLRMLEERPEKTPPPEPEPEAEAPGEPFTAWLLETFLLQGGRIVWRDLSVGGAGAEPVEIPVTLESIQAGPVLGTLDAPIPVTGQLGLPADGAIQWEGEAIVSSNAASIQVQLSDLPTHIASPYLRDLLDLSHPSGTLDVDVLVEASVDPEGVPSLEASGDVVVENNQVLLAENDAELLEFERIHLQDFVARFPDLSFEAAALTLQGLHPRLYLDETQQPILPGLPQAEGAGAPAEGDGAVTDAGTPDTEPVAEAPAGAGLPPVRIERIVMTGSHVTVEDRSFAQPLKLSVNDMELTLEPFSTDPSVVSELDFTARVAGQAPLSVKGTLVPLDQQGPADLAIQLDAFDLEAIEPVFERYLGRELDSGQFTLKLPVQLEQGQLNAPLNVILADLDLGASVESEDAVQLPIGLAIGLLKGADGNINQTIPLSGDVTSPGFNIGAILADNIRQQILRITTAPFRFLGNLVPGRGGEAGAAQGALATQSTSGAAGAGGLGLFRFEPGVTALSADHAAQVDDMVSILRQRPDLKLRIEGRFHPDADRNALLSEHLREQLLPYVENAPAGMRTEEALQRADVYAATLRRAYEDRVGSVAAEATEAPTAPDDNVGQSDETTDTQALSQPDEAEGAVTETAAPTLTLTQMQDALRAELTLEDGELERLADTRAENVQNAFLGKRPALSGRLERVPAAAVEDLKQGPAVTLGIEILDEDPNNAAPKQKRADGKARNPRR